MRGSLVSFSRRIPANHVALSELRQAVSAWLNAELDSAHPTVVADVALVLTELTANVVDHTDAAFVDVDLEVVGDRVTIEVRNEGTVYAIPPLQEWGGGSEGDRGRGLRLVAAFCDEVLIGGDEHRTRITCRRHLE